jgi:hypothetical protein
LEEKEQILQEDVQEIADFLYDVDVQLAAIARERRERADTVAAAIAAATAAAAAAPVPAPTVQAVPAASASEAPAATKTQTTSPTAGTAAPALPVLYKILALDPLTQQVVSASATSSSFPSPSTTHAAPSSFHHTPTSSPSSLSPATDEAVSLAHIMPRLNSPARFLPYIGQLESQGFEIVSGGGDVLVFKKVREPAAAAEPTVEPAAAAAAAPIPTVTTTTTTTTTAPATAAAAPLDPSRPLAYGFINPIDGTTMGNFASPTGFVSYNTLLRLEEEDEEEGGGGGSGPKASQSNTAGPRTHRQPSGDLKDALARRTGVVSDGSAAARADNALRTVTIADAARNALGAAKKTSSTTTTIPAAPAAAVNASSSRSSTASTVAAPSTSSPSAHASGSSSSSSADAKRKKMPLARRMVFVGAWVAACSYAVGVVADFFATGGSSGAGIQGF